MSSTGRVERDSPMIVGMYHIQIDQIATRDHQSRKGRIDEHHQFRMSASLTMTRIESMEIPSVLHRIRCL